MPDLVELMLLRDNRGKADIETKILRHRRTVPRHDRSKVIEIVTLMIIEKMIDLDDRELLRIFDEFIDAGDVETILPYCRKLLLDKRTAGAAFIERFCIERIAIKTRKPYLHRTHLKGCYCGSCDACPSPKRAIASSTVFPSNVTADTALQKRTASSSGRWCTLRPVAFPRAPLI